MPAGHPDAWCIHPIVLPMAHELSAGPRASRYTSRGGLFERPLLTFRMKEASMLGIVLLYVGIVLISNGCYGLLGIEDKSNVVMNLFTGGLGLVLNIIAIGIGVAQGQTPRGTTQAAPACCSRSPTSIPPSTPSSTSTSASMASTASLLPSTPSRLVSCALRRATAATGSTDSSGGRGASCGSPPSSR